MRPYLTKPEDREAPHLPNRKDLPAIFVVQLDDIVKMNDSVFVLHHVRSGRQISVTQRSGMGNAQYESHNLSCGC
jgi:hypothetical protein